MNPHKIVFFAKDVEATREAIVARGAKMRDIRTLVFCHGTDPEGHLFEIPHRG